MSYYCRSKDSVLCDCEETKLYLANDAFWLVGPGYFVYLMPILILLSF